jgi:hypothetical protein
MSMPTKKHLLVLSFLAVFASDVSASFGETNDSHSNLSTAQSYSHKRQSKPHTVDATAHGKPSDSHLKQAAVGASNTVTKESSSEVAEGKAIALVEKTKEVRSWRKEFGPTGINSATNGKPAFDVESHHGSIYVVHVFEDKPEQALTFARYEANIKTGRVRKVDGI